MTYDELLKLKPGTRFREPFAPRRLWHLRAVVDEMLVLRTWDRKRRRWHYVVEGPSWWATWRGVLEVSPPAFERGGACTDLADRGKD